MKLVIYVTILMLLFSSNIFSQSSFELPEGSELILDAGSDLTADIIIINGTISGGGTINGSTPNFLNLTVLIQGLYDPSSDLMIGDEMRVYLRSDVSPYLIIDSSVSALNSSGAGTFYFSNVVNGVNYYIQLKHRNSIETWSNSATAFVSNNMTYNFTNAATQAYGDNMIQVNLSPARFAIYSGDVNQDGIIDAGDLSQVENDASESLSGYVLSDLTGDDFVDAGDLAIVENNAGLSVTVVTP